MPHLNEIVPDTSMDKSPCTGRRPQRETRAGPYASASAALSSRPRAASCGRRHAFVRCGPRCSAHSQTRLRNLPDSHALSKRRNRSTICGKLTMGIRTLAARCDRGHARHELPRRSSGSGSDNGSGSDDRLGLSALSLSEQQALHVGDVS